MEPSTERVMDLHLAVGEVLGHTRALSHQMNEVKTDFREFKQRVTEEQTKLDDRLADVEKFMWKATGIAIASSTLIPLGVTIIAKYVGG